MKKLIAAITVSFMMLSLMTGCGAEKSFDGDILDVISFDMSKTEILENAEKEFGEIGYMSGRDEQSVEDPMEAEVIIYYLESLYGYKGEVMLTFDWKLRTLQEMGVFYVDIDSETADQQYEDILNQFTEIYGQPYEDEYGYPMLDTGEGLINLVLRKPDPEHSLNNIHSIYIYIAPEEVFYPNK